MDDAFKTFTFLFNFLFSLNTNSSVNLYSNFHEEVVKSSYVILGCTLLLNWPFPQYFSLKGQD